ncbi:MAG TPA: P1 family peptidase [Gemmatimonadaceae bacterium]|nr:P1 family peptidase [Gemmatimonadaceae bacterium]
MTVPRGAIRIDTTPSFASLGVAVGHATDEEGATGCTVVRPVEGAMRGAAAVVGRATGTRELLPLTTHHLVDRVDAILLTGGSAYGLDAAAGVMRWMEEHGRGFPVGRGVVPIVPAAVIFDLAPLGSFDARPTAEMAYEACGAARADQIGEGSIGAGTGATVGKAAGPGCAMKGGFGCATARAGHLVAGAVAVVNALGDVRDSRGRIIAGARSETGGFADSVALLASGISRGFAAEAPAPASTTLAVVAVSSAFSRADLASVAEAATAGLHRRVTPAGTAFDGDIVFALSPLDGEPGDPVAAGVLAACALEEAIERAVRLARGRDGIPGLADEGDPFAGALSR